MPRLFPHQLLIRPAPGCFFRSRHDSGADTTNFSPVSVKFDGSSVTYYLTLDGLAPYTIEGSKKGVRGPFRALNP